MRLTWKKALDAGQMLLDYGHKHSNIRNITMGYQFISYSHFIAGDLPLAIEYAQKAIQISVDPLYSIGGNLLIGFSHAFLGEFQKIGEMAKQTWKFCQDVGCEVWGTLAKILTGVTYIASGQMSQGLKKAEDHFNKAIEIAPAIDGRKQSIGSVRYLTVFESGGLKNGQDNNVNWLDTCG